MRASRSVAPSVIRSRWTRIRLRWERFTEPGLHGLPSRRVLLAFPALLLILGALLVGLSLNGNSSGAMYDRVYTGSDPALLAGHPQLIRSDEWYVGTSWSIAQVQQGLPERNQTMPGGMDAALPHDLPRLDWSVIFRPHLWGYVLFDVGHATAWKWWLPAFSLMAAAYGFLVTLLPRRAVLSAAITVGFFFSPFFQWWFQSVIFWPTTWALVTMTALIWAVKHPSWRIRWSWAAIIAYLTVVMMMGVYAPFIVPIVIVVAFFGIGLLIEHKRGGSSWLTLLKQAIPIVIAGVAGAGITSGWLATKSATVDAFLGTAYPGERLTATGSSDLLSLARAVSSSFSESLKRGAGFLGTNSSEASTFFFIGIFLLPVVAWIVYRSAKQRLVLPWALLGLSAVIVLFLAFFYLPGWNGVAHLLFLDRTSEGRMRIGLGLVSLAILGYVIRYLDEHKVRATLTLSITSAAIFLTSQTAIAAAVLAVMGSAKLWHDAPLWWAYTIASAIAIYAFARRRNTLGAIAFFLVAVASTITVNPVYVGVFDLRTTAASQAVMKINATTPGTWLGLGGVETSAILLESGVRAFNGVQGAPSMKMWHEIDPSSKYEFLWNRLADISWTPAVGAPVITNPAPDQILVTFDACASFAQKNVDYVLTDTSELKSSCLIAQREFPLPAGKHLTIYRVEAPTG